MQRLLGQSCYLAGPIDRAADGGVGWRQAVTPALQDMGVVVYDPTNKPTDIAREDSESRRARREAKLRGDYDRLVEDMWLIRHLDRRMVDYSSFIIAYLDLDVYACGTMDEIFQANAQKKPILTWCPQGKRYVPDYLFGTFPHEMMFDGLAPLLGYLRGVDDGTETETFRRWLFFDPAKLYTPQILDRLQAAIRPQVELIV
jgi:hypothetical protein